MRFVVAEEAYAGGPYYLAEESNRRIVELANECPALSSLPGADRGTITSGMADALFQAVNACCDRIDAITTIDDDRRVDVDATGFGDSARFGPQHEVKWPSLSHTHMHAGKG